MRPIRRNAMAYAHGLSVSVVVGGARKREGTRATGARIEYE